MKKLSNMRPIREHFDTLDEYLRLKAYRAAERSPGLVSDLNYPSPSLSAALGTAIHWDDTDEGRDFWETLYNKHINI